jgi:hypothetical protein
VQDPAPGVERDLSSGDAAIDPDSVSVLREADTSVLRSNVVLHDECV